MKKKKLSLKTIIYLVLLVVIVIVGAVFANIASKFEVVVKGGSGSGKYKKGAVVTATADQDDQEFVRWNVDYGNIELEDETAKTISFEMPEKNVGVTALYLETWTEKDGTVYTGTRVSEKIHGTGSAVFKNGDLYEGEFYKGKMSGIGTYSWVDEAGNIYKTYEGEVTSDRFSGAGVATYYDAEGNVTETYDGKFSSGSRSGEGTGSLYDGEAVTQKYVGEWSNDRMTGAGVYEWYDENGNLVNKFEGEIAVVETSETEFTYELTGTYYTYAADGKEESKEDVAAGSTVEMQEIGIGLQ